QPRVGLAWQLNGSGTTVLRAGFGVLHDHIMPNAYVGFASNNPQFYLTETVNGTSGNPVKFPNAYTLLSLNAAPRATYFLASFKEPVKNSYSLSLQQQVMK